MKTKTIIAIILTIVLTIGMLATLVACNPNASKGPKRAIIYVTALFSGGLYYEAEDEYGVKYNEAIWEPFENEVSLYGEGESAGFDLNGIVSSLTSDGGIADILSLLGDVLSYKPGTLLYDLSLDQDGNSNNPDIIPANDEPRDIYGNIMDISYGVFGIYKPFVDNLRERYGDKYEVSVFNYDWRYSPADAGEKLQNYINEKGYEEVILMSHSMGGPTVNQYLVRSKANRDKVKLYMGFAPATLGSFDALAALTCPMDYISYMAGDLLNEIPPTVMKLVEGKIEKLLGFIYNNIGLMTLVPSYQYLSSAQYGEGEAGIYVKRLGDIGYKPLTTKDEIYNFYMTRDWAYYLDEEGNKIKDNASPVGYKLKKPVKNLSKYYDSFFQDGTFAAETVNSYYFVGTGVGSTITSMYCSEKFDGSWSYELKTNTGSGKLGDGTVPYYSSIGGQDPSKIKEGHLIELEGKSHIDVGADWNLLKDDVYRLIDSVI